MPRKLHKRLHKALDRFKNGMYRRRKGAAAFKDMDLDTITNDLREFYRTSEGGIFEKYLPDFEKAVIETLEQLAKGN